jgi:hypothetical protein
MEEGIVGIRELTENASSIIHRVEEDEAITVLCPGLPRHRPEQRGMRPPDSKRRPSA